MVYGTDGVLVVANSGQCKLDSLQALALPEAFRTATVAVVLVKCSLREWPVSSLRLTLLFFSSSAYQAGVYSPDDVQELRSEAAEDAVEEDLELGELDWRQGVEGTHAALLFFKQPSRKRVRNRAAQARYRQRQKVSLRAAKHLFHGRLVSEDFVVLLAFSFFA